MRDDPERSRGSWFYRGLKGALGLLAILSAVPSAIRDQRSSWGGEDSASEGHDLFDYKPFNLTPYNTTSAADSGSLYVGSGHWPSPSHPVEYAGLVPVFAGAGAPEVLPAHHLRGATLFSGGAESGSGFESPLVWVDTVVQLVAGVDADEAQDTHHLRGSAKPVAEKLEGPLVLDASSVLSIGGVEIEADAAAPVIATTLTSATVPASNHKAVDETVAAIISNVQATAKANAKANPGFNVKAGVVYYLESVTESLAKTNNFRNRDEIIAALETAVDTFVADDTHLRVEARKLATACALTFTLPSSPTYYTESTSSPHLNVFTIGLTQATSCLPGNPTLTLITINPALGKPSNSDGSNSGSPWSASNGNTVSSYSFDFGFTGTAYNCDPANPTVFLVQATSSTGAFSSTAMALICQQVSVPITLTSTDTLSRLDLSIGGSTLYQIPLSSYVTNLNNYPLVVSTNSSAWVGFVNSATGSVSFTPVAAASIANGGQGGSTVYFKVQATGDPGFVTLKLPAIVLNRIPTAGSFSIPSKLFGTGPLNTTVPIKTLFADGDGLVDFCPGSEATCRVSLNNAPAGMTFNNATGELFYNPPAPSIYTADLVVTDFTGASATTPISAAFLPSLGFTNTNVTQITQGGSIAIPVSLSTPGLPSLLASVDPSLATSTVNNAIVSAMGCSAVSGTGTLTISGPSDTAVNAVLASLRLTGSVTNRGPVPVTFYPSDSLGQSLTGVTKLITVIPVDHPLTATGFAVSIPGTVSTVATSFSITNAHMGNIDNVLWTLSRVRVFNSAGALVADSDSNLNGLAVTGLNGPGTNLGAQLVITPAAGSRAGSYPIEIDVLSVDSTGAPLPGMPILTLNSTLAVANGVISVPAIDLPRVGAANTSTLIFPRATMIGDNVTEIFSLPSGCVYDPVANSVRVTAGNVPSVPIRRVVSAAHDPAWSSTVDYTVFVDPTLAVTELASVTSVVQDQLTVVPLAEFTTPASGTPSVSVTVNSIPLTLQANSTLPGMSLTQISPGKWQLNATLRTTTRAPVVVSWGITDSALQRYAPTSPLSLSVVPVVHPAVTALPLTALSTTPTKSTTLVVTGQNWVNQDSDPSWKVLAVRLVKNGITVANDTSPGTWTIGGAINQVTSSQAVLSITPPPDSQASVDSVEVDVQFFDASGVPTQVLKLETPYSVTTTPITVPTAALSSADVGRRTTYVLPAYDAPGISCNDTILNLPVGSSYNATTRELSITPSGATQVNLVRQVTAVVSGESAQQIYSVTGVASLGMTNAIDNTVIQDGVTTLTLGTIKTPAGPPVVSVYVNSVLMSSVPTVDPHVSLAQIDAETWQVSLTNYVTHGRAPLSVSANLRDAVGQALTQTGIFSVTPVIHPATAAAPLSDLSIFPTKNGTLSVGVTNFDDSDGDRWGVDSVGIFNTDTGLEVANSTNLNGWVIRIDPGSSNQLVRITPPVDSQGSYTAKVRLQFSDASGLPTKTLTLENAVSVASPKITIPTKILPNVGAGQVVVTNLPRPTADGVTLNRSIPDLPTGWSFNPATGDLTMRPTTVKSVSFTEQVCDITGTCDTQTYSVNVVAMIDVSGDTSLERIAYVGRPLRFQLPPASSSVDPRPVKVKLQTTAGVLAPAWLQPDPLTGFVNTTVPSDAIGLNLIPVYYMEGVGVEADTVFRAPSFTLTTEQALQVQAADPNLQENTVGEFSVGFTYPDDETTAGKDVAVVVTVSSLVASFGVNAALAGSVGITPVVDQFEGNSRWTVTGPRDKVAALAYAIPTAPALNYFGTSQSAQITVVVRNGVDERTTTTGCTVAHVDQPPHVVTNMADVTWTQGQPSQTVSYANVFGDVDPNDIVTIRVSGALPVGVQCDPSTKTCTIGAGGVVPPVGSHAITLVATDVAGKSISVTFNVIVNPAPDSTLVGSLVDDARTYGQYLAIAVGVAPVAYKLFQMIQFSIGHRINSRKSRLLLEATLSVRDEWRETYSEQIAASLRKITAEALRLILLNYTADSVSHDSVSDADSSEGGRVTREDTPAALSRKQGELLGPGVIGLTALQAYARAALRLLLKSIVHHVKEDKTAEKTFEEKLACWDMLASALSFFSFNTASTSDVSSVEIPKDFENSVLKQLLAVGERIKSALEEGDVGDRTKALSRLYLTLLEHLFYLKSHHGRPISVVTKLKLFDTLYAAPGVNASLPIKLLNKLICKPKPVLPTSLILILKLATAVLSRVVDDDGFRKILRRLFSTAYTGTRLTPSAVLWENKIELLRYMTVIALSCEGDMLFSLLEEYMLLPDTHPHLLHAYQEKLNFLLTNYRNELTELQRALTSAASVAPAAGGAGAEAAGVGIMLSESEGAASAAAKASPTQVNELQKAITLVEGVMKIRRRVFFIMNRNEVSGKKEKAASSSVEGENGFTTEEACLAKLIEEFESTRLAVIKEVAISSDMDAAPSVSTPSARLKEFYSASLGKIAKQHPRVAVRTKAIEALRRANEKVVSSCGDNLKTTRTACCGVSRKNHKKLVKSAGLFYFREPRVVAQNPMRKFTARTKPLTASPKVVVRLATKSDGLTNNPLFAGKMPGVVAVIRMSGSAAAAAGASGAAAKAVPPPASIAGEGGRSVEMACLAAASTPGAAPGRPKKRASMHRLLAASPEGSDSVVPRPGESRRPSGVSRLSVAPMPVATATVARSSAESGPVVADGTTAPSAAMFAAAGVPGRAVRRGSGDVVMYEPTRSSFRTAAVSKMN